MAESSTVTREAPQDEAAPERMRVIADHWLEGEVVERSAGSITIAMWIVDQVTRTPDAFEPTPATFSASEAEDRAARADDMAREVAALRGPLPAQSLDRSALRKLIHHHGGEFFGPRVEHVSMEEQAFWRFLDEVIAIAGASALAQREAARG